MSESNDLIRLNNVTLSFPTLVIPKAFAPGQPEKYSADFIMDAGNADMAKFTADGIRQCKEKWADKAAAIINMIKGTKKLRCFGTGSERMKTDGTIYKGYEGLNGDGEGVVYLGGNTKDQPDCYDADGTKLMNVGKLYGGCKVNAIVRPWIQDNKYGKAIRCDLIAIQFVADGDALGGGGRPDTEGLFQRIEGAPEPVDSGADDYEF